MFTFSFTVHSLKIHSQFVRKKNASSIKYFKSECTLLRNGDGLDVFHCCHMYTARTLAILAQVGGQNDVAAHRGKTVLAVFTQYSQKPQGLTTIKTTAHKEDLTKW